VGAHKERRLGQPDVSEGDVARSDAVQPDVSAPAIATGTPARNDADPFKDVEMVGEEVGRSAREPLQLEGRSVRRDELVDDGEASGVTEGGVPSRPSREGDVLVHRPIVSVQQSVSQLILSDFRP
jgi:hypothetical protein